MKESFGIVEWFVCGAVVIIVAMCILILVLGSVK